jgi:predicted RNA-binding Zn ribbon-like protein
VLAGYITFQLRLTVMSKQQEAPGELEHVRAFVNTIDVEQGTEQLTDPAELAAWLVAHGLGQSGGLRANEADLDNAIRLRGALRRILLSHVGADQVPTEAAMELDLVACRSRLRLRFDEQGGAALEPQARGVDGALGRLLAIVHRSIALGTWDRLKACRGRACAWAFYDHTKNRSGAWCNMQVCGNRAKARSYRERRAGPTAVVQG